MKKRIGIMLLLAMLLSLCAPALAEATDGTKHAITSASFPAYMENALDIVGPMKLIAAHMGGWGCWHEAKELLSETGIFIDTAFSMGMMTPVADQHKWKIEDLQLLNKEAFCELVQAFGAKKVLFGTDSPWAEPEQELRKIRDLPLAKEDIFMILGENAKLLLSV